MGNALKTLIPVALLCGAFPATLPAQDDNPVLLEVDGAEFRLDYMLHVFEEEHQGHLRMLGDATEVAALVDRILDFRLLVVGALSEGYGENEEILKRVDTFHRQLVSQKYREEQTVMGVAVEREAIDEFADRLGVSYHLREIGTHTRAAAQEAAKTIRGGTDFIQVCKKYSTLASKLHNGSTFKRLDEMPAKMRQWILGAEPGSVSDPIMTPQGYLVMLFENAEDQAPPEYALSNTRIMSLLMQEKVENRRVALRDDLRRQFGARITTAPEAAWFHPDSEQDGSTVLGRADGLEPVTLDMVRAAMTLPEKMMGDDALVLELAEYLVRQILDDDILQETAMQTRWAEDEEILRQVRSFRDQLLVTALKAERIYADLKPTEEEIQAVFEQEKDDWRLPDQVEVRHIVVDDQALAQRLKAEIDAGADFEQVAQDNSIDKATARKGGYVGWVVPGKIHPALDKILFDLPVGAVSDPVQSPVGWHILKTIRRTKGQTRPLSAVRMKFTEKMMAKRRAEAKAEWLRLLRERVDWTVHTDHFDRALEIIRARLEDKKLKPGTGAHQAF